VATTIAAAEEAFLSPHASNTPSACNRHVANSHDSPEELNLQSANKLDNKATQSMTAYSVHYMLNLLSAPQHITNGHLLEGHTVNQRHTRKSQCLCTPGAKGHLVEPGTDVMLSNSHGRPCWPVTGQHAGCSMCPQPGKQKTVFILLILEREICTHSDEAC
jgi:hypothetical protein